MKVAFLTDLHLLELKAVGRISNEQERALTRSLEIITRRSPDLILLGGDNSGHAIPHKSSLVERNRHIELRLALAEIAPVVEVMGNHDYPDDYVIFNKIRSVHPITFTQQPCYLEFKELDAVVWCFPWLYKSTAETTHQQNLIDTYANFIEQRRSEDDDKINILLAHGAVSDAYVRIGQPRSPTSDPVLTAEQWMPAGAFDVGFFGHYHDYQILHGEGGTKGFYGGSLTLDEYGECPDKGVLIWESGSKTHEHVPTYPPIRAKVVFDAGSNSFTSVGAVDTETSDEADRRGLGSARVEIVHSVAPKADEEEVIATFMTTLSEGFSSVAAVHTRTEIQTTRAATAAIAAMNTDHDKLRTYLNEVHAVERGSDTEKAILELFDDVVNTVNNIAKELE